MEPLRKYLLDANIYGELAVDSEVDKVGARKLRITLLALYDALTGKHELLVADEHRTLSGEYYKAYVGFGGTEPKRVMSNDFLLVACASAKSMDVVASDDEKTMLAENAVRAYSRVNGLLGVRTPDFIGYEKFKSDLKSCSLRSGGSGKLGVLPVFIDFLCKLFNIGLHASNSYFFIYKPFYQTNLKGCSEIINVLALGKQGKLCLRFTIAAAVAYTACDKVSEAQERRRRQSGNATATYA